MSREEPPKHTVSRRSFLRAGAGIGLGTLALPRSLRLLIAQSAAVPSAKTTAVRIVSHGDRSKHQLALTVDDGWDPDRVRLIFELLQHQQVKATFMPYARAMTWDRALWRRIAEAGYPIGNHTTTHPFLTRLPPVRQLAEIADGRSIAEGIIGRPTTRVFRPPYGDYNRSVVGAAVEAGFPTIVLWDTSDRDTSPHGTAQEMLAAAEQGQNGSILLTHGGPAVTPTIMPAILAFYRARGFEFVTLGELLGVAGPKPAFSATAESPAALPPPAEANAPSSPGALLSATPPAEQSLSASQVATDATTPARPTAPRGGADAAAPGTPHGPDASVALIATAAVVGTASVAIGARRLFRPERRIRPG